RGTERRLPSSYETSIFRLVQEAISNAIRHGKATDIKVELEWLKEHVNIIVRDNGTGFDAEIVKNQSFGLIGMRERIELIKGEFIINSNLGEGTTLLFQIPYEMGI